jgi:hypothetical protein
MYGLYKMFGASGGLPKDFEAKGYADGGDVRSAGMAGMGSDMGMQEYLRSHPEEAGAVQPMGAGLAGLMPARDFSEIPMDGAIPMGQIPQPGRPMGAGIGPAFGGSNEDYVNSLYANMLGRQADQGGYQHNLDLLNSGRVSAQDLAGAFRNSAEGQRMPSRNVLMGAGMPAASGLSDIRLNQLLGAR